MSAIDWTAYAACTETDPEIFYPARSEVALGRFAKSICARCDVLDQCRRYVDALETDAWIGSWHWGIFAGESPGERIKRRRREAAA